MPTWMKAALLAVVFATAADVVQATTITFDDFPASSTTILTDGATFTTGGYDFDLKQGPVYFLNMSSSSGYATNGTTSLDLGGIVDITSASGKPFSVTSVDLATVFASATSTVRFTGTDINGARTSQTFSINGTANADPYGLITTPLAGFTNLSAFEMELVYNPDGSAYFSLIDNIVIDDADATVPEPATFATLGLGLALLAGSLRRKPRSHGVRRFAV
jgi:hypothetical protein